MCSRGLRLLCAITLLAGCVVGRYVRIEQKGLTCTEAHRIAIEAVRRMGYTITDTTKPSPGAPGLIVAAREEGINKHSMLVNVFCTTVGAEVQAQSDQGGLAQLDFSNEFRRSFEAASTNRGPARAAATTGLDVLLTPNRDGGAKELGIDLSDRALLPVSVRITNHTARAYRFDPQGVVLKTAGGERAHALKVQEVTARLGSDATGAVQQKVLHTRDVGPNETVSGVLFFPFNAYTRARVELTDRSSGESEGFSIEL